MTHILPWQPTLESSLAVLATASLLQQDLVLRHISGHQLGEGISVLHDFGPHNYQQEVM